jgi:hypothetical protein
VRAGSEAGGGIGGSGSTSSTTPKPGTLHKSRGRRSGGAVLACSVTLATTAFVALRLDERTDSADELAELGLLLHGRDRRADLLERLEARDRVSRGRLRRRGLRELPVVTASGSRSGSHRRASPQSAGDGDVDLGAPPGMRTVRLAFTPIADPIAVNAVRRLGHQENTRRSDQPRDCYGSARMKRVLGAVPTAAARIPPRGGACILGGQPP